MVSREFQQSSMALMRSAYRDSGNASATGMPRPSLGTRPMNSPLAHSMTWRGPRKSAIAAPIAVPLAVVVPVEKDR